MDGYHALRPEIGTREQGGMRILIPVLFRLIGLASAIVIPLAASRQAAAGGPPPGSRPPNVLFLLPADHPPPTIPPLGHPVLPTPHLDALVGRGTAFTRAISPNPLCVPSRAEILTGC